MERGPWEELDITCWQKQFQLFYQHKNELAEVASGNGLPTISVLEVEAERSLTSSRSA
jgi:hypothetical protein